MILNMTGGESPVQVYDFTLSSDVSVGSSGGLGTTDVLEINNVFVPDGVHGFCIMPNDETAHNRSMCVSHIYTDYLGDSGVTQGNLRYVYFGPNSSSVYNYMISRNENSNAFVYNASTRRLGLATSLATSYVGAGKYRLLIW